ncbi:hypothetical protein A6V36_30450 [Paraburkholderia ginsengiterrae]|uniref:Uncharacterized protein n=1 Tax=Paraburkholderia ginsengiterrae TaxID=1462993 RepID=A0A1A9N4A5_9BURK|nr:hypothetical protein A6V37_32170 [Paraburkholderia ginsengiterrae]OAJ58565.1 hypothetical protein A6V36_30450 [Paraburkholderia ginsengiterrae]
MPIWMAASVSEQPVIELLQWRIFEIVPDGERHFVGRNAQSYNGRVSSSIQLLDADRRQGITLSGRVYVLIGPPGFASVCQYVWDQWCERNQVSSYHDVTDELSEENWQ